MVDEYAQRSAPDLTGRVDPRCASGTGSGTS
jgi:hypothetical protein